MAGGGFLLIFCCSVAFCSWTHLRFSSHNFLLTHDICFELISPRLTNLGIGVRSALGIGSDGICI